jgi:epoxyqueuosine reductase
MDSRKLAIFLKEELTKEGFFEFRINKIPNLLTEKKGFEQWLVKGFHGKMSYLEKNLDLRFQPETIMEGTQTIITVLLSYFPAEKLPFTNNYRIAKYAYGKDYHDVIKSKLNRVAEEAVVKFGDFQFRSFTDSAPIPDRHLAQKSGLGWIGKNTLLINKNRGSFFFIGHLFLDIKLPEDEIIIQEDLCLDCNKCLKACPTQALYAPYKMDATKCLSYQTIENKSAEKDIPPQKFRGYIYGCDICQDVCPFNSKPISHSTNEFKPHPELFEMTKEKWQHMEPMQFGEIFRGSAVKRAGYKGIKQNINWIGSA